MNQRFKHALNGIDLHPIGIIRTSHHEAAGTPIQPTYAHGTKGQVVVEERYAEALDDIEGFERIWLLYWMDRAGPFRSRVVPYRDNQEHGLFATRSPCRPNPIGLSVVRLVQRQGRVLVVSNVDILDGTPLLDIKPYVPTFDSYAESKSGWFDSCGTNRTCADDRFHVETGHKIDAKMKSLKNCELLPSGEVVLPLQEFCIQTAVKRARHELIVISFNGSESESHVEAPIELLGRFLETTDFRELRSNYPELAGGTKCRVSIHECDDGMVHWNICSTS